MVAVRVGVGVRVRVIRVGLELGYGRLGWVRVVAGVRIGVCI